MDEQRQYEGIRCAYFGELLQMACFDTQYALNGCYHVFEQILTDYGIPYKFLTDKQTVFNYKKKCALSDDKYTYIPSSLTPASNLLYSLNQAAYHRLKNE